MRNTMDLANTKTCRPKGYSQTLFWQI